MAGRLVVTLNGQIEGEYVLSEERTTIGRHPECDICIDDMAASGRHALIINILEDCFLEDLHSTNGIYVNGSLTQKAALSHGDLIAIGSRILRYEDSAQSAQRGTKDTGTKVEQADECAESDLISPGVLAAAGPSADRAIPADILVTDASARDRVLRCERTGPVARLKVMTGPAAGRRLTLDDETVTLGKPGVQVTTICKRDDEYVLNQIDGEDPPHINGKPTRPVDYLLQDHDVLELVGVELEFTFEE